MEKPLVLLSKIVHANPWYRIRQDKLVWPNGTPGEYFVTELPSSAMIICKRGEDVLMIHQFRHTIQRTTLEFPGGRCDQDEHPLETAKRELREETGIEGTGWTHLGTTYAATGIAHGHNEVYLASVEHEGAPSFDDYEQQAAMQKEWVPLSHIGARLSKGELICEQTMSAILLLQTHLPTSS